MRIVDTRGQLCPAPLIASKKALRETEEEESFIILTDNLTSYDNLCRFLTNNKAVFNSSEEEGTWTLTVTKTTSDVSQRLVEDSGVAAVKHFQKGNYIVALSSDKMGDGDIELGNLLIGNFIKALKDLDTLPAVIVFYNRGVMLAAEDSEVISHLADLGKMGVELLICATCVNYYNLAGKIRVGTLSNMFVIAQAMAEAGNIIKP